MTEKDFEKLVFGMAHQIRNPCAIIKSNVELLLQTHDLKPEVRHSLEAIKNGVKYLEERLQEFVEFSKPLRLNLKPVLLKQVFQEVLNMVKEKASLQKTVLSCTMDENLMLSKADAHLLFLALFNIVINAIEAISWEGGKVIVTGERKGSEIEIRIQDSGCGIHPRDLPEVFSPFYSTKKGGIGIGLAVAKRIIDGHNGRISLSSTQGKGTTVTVQLPI